MAATAKPWIRQLSGTTPKADDRAKKWFLTQPPAQQNNLGA
jgi:hypothetical protein